jgi:hypothetical protein
MRGLYPILSAALLALPLTAGAQSNHAVTVIDNPGGGTIAYASMLHQHTLRGALGKVLMYVHGRFGARPHIERVMRGSDGNSLALTFSVKSPSVGHPEIAGLALVAVSSSGPAKGAVLSDRADRFRSTVGPMLRRLQSGAGLSGASSAPARAAPSASGGSPASDTAASAAIPAAALHQTPFPDGSGSIGLPDGWTITGAHAGQVIAKGPGGAGLRFNWPIAVLDPTDPRSRGSGGAGFIAIPYGTDAAATFKAAITQLSRKAGNPPPTIDILNSKRVSPQETLLVADVDVPGGSGPLRSLIDIGIGPLNDLGGYTIVLYTISFPRQIAKQSEATVTAMFHSYKANQAVAVAQIQQDEQTSQRITDNAVANMQRTQDVQDRQFQAFDNNLLDRTVIRDNDLHGDGTVSNDLAQALIDANPDRFQEVSPNDYVKGIDY